MTAPGPDEAQEHRRRVVIHDHCGNPTPCPCLLDPIEIRRARRDIAARHRAAVARARQSGWARARRQGAA